MERRIRYMDVVIKTDNLIEDGRNLIATLRPDWPADQIQHEVMTDGFVNEMVCYFLEKDAAGRREGLMLRKYGDATDGFLDRDTEFTLMQLAAEAGSSKKIIAVFNNGFVYEWTNGRMLTWRDFINPKIVREYGRKLAQLHFTDYSKMVIVNRKGESISLTTRNIMPIALHMAVMSIPDHIIDKEKDKVFQANKLSQEESMTELNRVLKHYEDMQLEVMPCHNDAHMKNTVYDDVTGELYFVDYDGGMLGYGAAEITRNAILWGCREYVDWQRPDDPEEIDTPEMRRCLLTSYLEQKNEVQGRSADDVTEEMIDLKSLEFDILLITGHFLWAIVCASIANKVLFDAIGQYKLCLDVYAKSKQRLPDLIQEYKDRKAKLEAQNVHI